MAAISARVFLLLPPSLPPSLFISCDFQSSARNHVCTGTCIRHHLRFIFAREGGERKVTEARRRDRWRRDRIEDSKKNSSAALFIPLTSLQISPHPSRISATFVSGKSSGSNANLRPLSFSTRPFSSRFFFLSLPPPSFFRFFASGHAVIYVIFSSGGKRG